MDYVIRRLAARVTQSRLTTDVGAGHLIDSAVWHLMQCVSDEQFGIAHIIDEAIERLHPRAQHIMVKVLLGLPTKGR